MLMKHTAFAMPKGLAFMPRADASPNAIFAELKTAMEEWRATVTEEMKGIKAKFDDVLTTEKGDRIDASITDLTAALDSANQQLAALTVGGITPQQSAEVGVHAQAFADYFQFGKGVAGLGDLEIKAALTTQSDPDGGYFVPHEVEEAVDRVLGTVSVMRQLANVRQVGSSTWSKFINMGGAASGWVGEEETRAETGTPNLREIRIDVNEIYAFPFTTQWMLDDSQFDVAAWLSDEVMIEFGEQEGLAHIDGDGLNKPRGLMTYDTIINSSWVWGKIGYTKSLLAGGFQVPTSTVSPADAFINLVGSLKSGHRAGAAWLMNDTTVTTIRKFKDGQGNFIWAEPTTATDVPTILGKPVHTDDNMPAVAADKFPIAFGNFNRAYTILDRIGIRVLRDPITVKGKVGFYTTKRTGGGLTNFEVMKFMKIEAA